MRLLYIYIEKYKKLENVELRLCSEYTVSKKDTPKRREVVLKIDRVDALPNDFYNVIEKCNPVHCVSALIGENGTCKTSIAQLFTDLASKCDDETKNKPKAIVLFEQGETIECYSSCDEKIYLTSDTGLKLSDRVNITEKECGFPFTFVYHSSFYTTESQISSVDSFFYDCSTSGLLRNGDDQSAKLEEAGLNPFQIFDIREKNRVWYMLQQYFNDIKNSEWNPRLKDSLRELGFKCPKRITIQLLDQVRKRSIDELKDYIENIRRKESGPQHRVYATLLPEPGALRDPCAEFLRVNVPLLENHGQSSFVVRAFVSYVAQYWLNVGVLKNNAVSEADRSLARFVAKKGISEDSIYTFLTKESKTFGYTYKFFMELRDLYRMCDVKDNLIIGDVSNKYIREHVFEFLMRAQVLGEIFNIVETNITPKLSSGEFSFLSLFSRIYEQFYKSKREDFVLFLDEAETTLHPNLQRRLVISVMKFLSAFFSSKRVHIIFASHSPVLLSDIPIGNVVFLKEEDSRVMIQDVRKESFRNTFGANIFDLYRTSFVLTDGPVGAFAAGKINELLRKVRESNNSIAQDSPDAKLVNLVGDPFIGRYLRSCISSN